MQETLTLLEKRERLLQKKAEQELGKAKECLKKGNKTAAKLAMKRKKTYETQIGRLQAQMANVQEMHMKLEEAATDKMTLDAQRSGAKQLKKVFKNTSLEEVEDQMESVREAMDDANEISEALAQSFGMDMDGDDIDDELAELEREEMDKQILSMKSVPKGKISSKETGETEPQLEKDIDDEFAELEMEFA